MEETIVTEVEVIMMGNKRKWKQMKNLDFAVLFQSPRFPKKLIQNFSFHISTNWCSFSQQDMVVAVVVVTVVVATKKRKKNGENEKSSQFFNLPCFHIWSLRPQIIASHPLPPLFNSHLECVSQYITVCCLQVPNQHTP